MPLTATAIQRIRDAGFKKGYDPRRSRGSISKDQAEIKHALTLRLPKALEVLDGLLEAESPKIRWLAAVEILDRTIGKPKAMDIDGEEIVRNEMATIFQRLRARMKPEEYASLIQAVADASVPEQEPLEVNSASSMDDNSTPGDES